MLLAKHYGFTEEELDFIINYDIKYRMGDELNKDNVKVGNADYSGFAVMPAAKAFWFRKPHVAMYSKLAAGVTLLDDYDEEADSHSFDPYWAAQVTLAGVQFGGERFRGFVEAGAGMQGLVLAGLSVSF